MSWWRQGLGRTRGSGFWLQFDEPESFRLGGIRFGDLLEGSSDWIGPELMGIAAAGRQVRQQRGEAVRRLALSGLLGLLFGFRGLGSFGGLDRVSFPARLFQFFVGK